MFNRKHTELEKQKISATLKGTTKSEETKEKIRQSLIKYYANLTEEQRKDFSERVKKGMKNALINQMKEQLSEKDFKNWMRMMKYE